MEQEVGIVARRWEGMAGVIARVPILPQVTDFSVEMVYIRISAHLETCSRTEKDANGGGTRG